MKEGGKRRNVPIRERIKQIPVLGNILFWLYSCFKMPIRIKELTDSMAQMKYSIDLSANAGTPPAVITDHCCYLGDNLAITRVRNFKMFVNTKDTLLTPHLIMGGCWEMHITPLFEGLIKEGFTVIDIGANMGYYTLIAGLRVGSSGRVYAFEPAPNNYDILRKNIEINGLSNIVISSQKALLDKQGEVEFRAYETQTGGSSIFYKDPQIAGQNISVQTAALDVFLGDTSKVDVIKLDAQGAEPLIFEGMKNVIASSPNLKIILEFAPECLIASGNEPGEFLQSILDMGFSIKLIDRYSGNPVKYNLDMLLNCDVEDLLLEKT